jgi:hypothetical protein
VHERCTTCRMSLLCLGGHLPLTRCRNCQRLFVYSEELHLVGYPHGDKRWPEGFFQEGADECLVETPLENANSCPRCSPWNYRWTLPVGQDGKRWRRWKVIDCDLFPEL